MGDERAEALLSAAERSLFDATVRVERAVAALNRQPGVDPGPTLEQARLWADLIQAALNKLATTEEDNS